MNEPITTPAPELFSIVPIVDADMDTWPIPEAPYYLVDRKGFFFHRTTRLGRVATRVDKPPQSLPLLDANGVLWEDVPKMKPEFLGLVWSFFARAYAEKHSEAVILLALDDDDQYHLMVPPQKVNHSSVDYKYTLTDVPNDWALIGTIHSHCDFSAFHSHTDEGDAAKHDGLHITMGFVDRDQPEMAIAISFAGHMWKDYKPELITNAIRLPKVDVPDHWLDMLNIYTPPPAPVQTTWPSKYSNPYQQGHRGAAYPQSNFGGYWGGGWGNDDHWQGNPGSWRNEQQRQLKLNGHDVASTNTTDDEIERWMSEHPNWAEDDKYNIFPDDAAYSNLTEKAADELEFDLKQLQQIAADRGLRIRFKITRRGVSAPPVVVSAND